MDERTARIAEDVKDIAHTRTAISDTLNLIERRVTDSIEEAKHTASEFVEHAKSTVEEAVVTTKQAVDPVYQATHHPWLLFSTAVLVGYTIGTATRSGKTSFSYTPPGTSGVPVMPNNGQQSEDREGVYSYYPPPKTQPPSGSDTFGHITGSGLIAEQFGAVKQHLASAAGTLISAWARELVPIIGKKLGLTLDSQDEDRSRKQEATSPATPGPAPV